MADFPLISVIITTKNEEKHIKACFDSILEQTYPIDKIEIIVVDNFSKDKTESIIKEYKLKNKNIYFFQKGPERSAQRNFGARKAKGKYYIYLDADMILSKNVIEEGQKKIEKDNLIALYIPEIVLGNSFWSKVRSFERQFYNGTVIDCVRFVLLDTFKKVNGFDEKLTGPEDWDFDKKIRSIGQTGIIKSPLYHNEAEFIFKKYLSKKKYYIKSFKTYINKWGKNDPDIKKQFSPFYRMFFVFIEKGKWKRLITNPILTLGMYSLRFFVGINFLINR